MNDAAARVQFRPCRFAAAFDAVRGISAAQCRVTAILGLCLTLITVVIFIIPLWQTARTNPWWAVLMNIAIVDQVNAFVLLIAIVIATRAVDEGYPPRNAYVLAALLGCVSGVVASETFDMVWRALVLTGPMPAQRPWLHGTAALYFRPIFALTNWLLIGSAAVFVYAGRRAALRTESRLRAAELDRVRRSKLALESRLQAMQARVEPQFLFNTLVRIERLYERNPEPAARMLDDLIAYLRAAMPLMRDTASTVSQELELARAYLDIVCLRLGERLVVTLPAAPVHEDIRMPPMLLLPIIDDVIVRRFDRADAATAISIRSDVDGGRLRLTVTDSGADLVRETGGQGLRLIRERMAALYGDNGSLQSRRVSPTVTETVLDIPLEHRDHIEAR